MALTVLGVGCAHAPKPPPEDATRDPEFQEALSRARPEFPRQRDALAAGVYETFVPPESLPPVVFSTPAAGAEPVPSEPRAAASRDPMHRPEDPSTEELLASLGAGLAPALSRVPVAPPSAPTPAPAPRPQAPLAVPSALGPYTIQIGAFGGPGAADSRAAEARAVARGLPVEIRHDAGVFRVLLGRFATHEDAEAALLELARAGLGAAWVTRFAR